MAVMVLVQLMVGTIALELNNRNTIKWLLLDWRAHPVAVTDQASSAGCCPALKKTWLFFINLIYG